MLAVVVEDSQDVKHVKEKLGNWLSKKQKIEKRDGNFWVFCNTSSGIDLDEVAGGCKGSVSIETYKDDDEEGPQLSPLQRLFHAFLASSEAIEPKYEDLTASCPKTWTVYQPMVLFGANSFSGQQWAEFMLEYKDPFFEFILRDKLFTGCTHVGINKPIREDDVMRRPFSMVPMYGNFGPDPTDSTYDSPTSDSFRQAFWCSTIQNGIYQEWSPRYTMFSRGNIKEKKRVLELPCALGDYIVDMYAGIGYFTLSYLHNGAIAFCWELNPWSIEGLLRGLKANGHKYKVIERNGNFTDNDFKTSIDNGVRAFVFKESNVYAVDRLKVISKPRFRHINLGLLPTARPSWRATHTLAAASTIPTTVHVHENVHVDEIEDFAQEVAAEFGQVYHVERVKTFAPDVWHIVVDAGNPT